MYQAAESEAKMMYKEPLFVDEHLKSQDTNFSAISKFIHIVTAIANDQMNRSHKKFFWQILSFSSCSLFSKFLESSRKFYENWLVYCCFLKNACF